MMTKNISLLLLALTLISTIYPRPHEHRLNPPRPQQQQVPPPYFFNAPMNFATVADTEHYPWLLKLLEVIRTNNKGHEINIIVFDIGLTDEEKEELTTQHQVRVVPIEMVHPDLCTKFVVRPNGRLARGWYAWKPVALHQAFEYFDYFLYIDSGKSINGPLDNIFYTILNEGCFLIDCGHVIRIMTTMYTINQFNLNSRERAGILDQFGVEAGIQGLTRKLFNDYIEPMYQLAHDLRNFEDDGTGPLGFGGARHDQTLFSIHARLLGLKVYRVDGPGPATLTINGYTIPFVMRNYFKYKNYDDNPKATECKLE